MIMIKKFITIGCLLASPMLIAKPKIAVSFVDDPLYGSVIEITKTKKGSYLTEALKVQTGDKLISYNGQKFDGSEKSFTAILNLLQNDSLNNIVVIRNNKKVNIKIKD